MIRLGLLHVESAIAVGTVGNPLYGVDAGHALAAAFVAGLPVVVWLIATTRPRRLSAIVDGYRTLPPLHQLAAWLLLVDAAAHLGLALGHGGVGLRVAFLVSGGWALFAIRRLALGRPWRLQAGLVLGGSILAYGAAILGGEPPDQIGLATKLVEVAGLAIVLRPAHGGPARELAASAVTIGLVVGLSVTGWVGAFQAAGDTEHGHDHGGGLAPPPGSRLPVAHDDASDATAAQRAAAAELQAATAIAIARYADPAVAAAAGYDVRGMHGLDFHAANDAYEHDGRVLDPSRPETLVYASGPHGPLLLGAMFVMPTIGAPGPAVGGPLTVWHAHEHVCIGLLPPGLTGILSPLGGCPVGSIDVPVTPEMIHVWTAPGVPQRFGDLADSWRSAYVASAG